jgi:hypothetical protein
VGFPVDSKSALRVHFQIFLESFASDEHVRVSLKDSRLWEDGLNSIRNKANLFGLGSSAGE